MSGTHKPLPAMLLRTCYGVRDTEIAVWWYGTALAYGDAVHPEQCRSAPSIRYLRTLSPYGHTLSPYAISIRYLRTAIRYLRTAHLTVPFAICVLPCAVSVPPCASLVLHSYRSTAHRRAPYAVSVPPTQCAGIMLPPPYAMCGTELRYHATTTLRDVRY
eukprot:2911392-Rhodomonas_salina.1